ncbi:MAG: RusA family crossover junction endodeoxyribonuclease [Pseudomonadota bacterium]
MRSHQSLHDTRLERGTVHGHQISHLNPQHVLHHQCPYTGRATTILTQGADAAPIDVDNVIKPIQDALNNVVYTDDSQLTDTDSHRRLLSETRDLTHASAPLIEVLSGDTEAVYIRVSEAVAAPGVYL